MCLTCREGGALEDVGEDGDASDSAHPNGDVMTLIVPSLLFSLRGEGNGDDGVDVVEEVMELCLCGDEGAYVAAPLPVAAILHAVDDAGCGARGAVSDEGCSLDKVVVVVEEWGEGIVLRREEMVGAGKVDVALEADDVLVALKTDTADGTVGGEEVALE